MVQTQSLVLLHQLVEEQVEQVVEVTKETMVGLVVVLDIFQEHWVVLELQTKVLGEEQVDKTVVQTLLVEVVVVLVKQVQLMKQGLEEMV